MNEHKNDNTSQRICRLNLRLTPAEHSQILEQSKQTNCRDLSEFIRRAIFGKKIIMITRDGSLDDVMKELIRLRKDLNLAGNNFNQVVRKLNTVNDTETLLFWLPVSEKLQQQIIRQIADIQLTIDQLSEKWLHGS